MEKQGFCVCLGGSFEEDADLPCGSQIPFFDQRFLKHLCIVGMNGQGLIEICKNII